jgi:acetyltransferase
MGGEGVREAAEICMLAGLPTYGTPEDAVEAFLQTVRYQRNQRLLMEAPPSLPEAFRPRTDAARAIVAAVLGAGRSMLTEPEDKALLAPYDIPAVPTRVAADAESARRAGADLGFPVALKILSPDITHKSDVGGVALDIASPEALVTEAGAMRERCAAHAPEARITGFTVQPMIRRARARAHRRPHDRRGFRPRRAVRPRRHGRRAHRRPRRRAAAAELRPRARPRLANAGA